MRKIKQPVNGTIHTKRIEIEIYTTNFENEFISLTDITTIRAAIQMMSSVKLGNTLEFLKLWESLHNSNFKPSNSVHLEVKSVSMSLSQ